jgi:hypothetical protein
MADKVSRFAPTGSMDKDSDPRYVGKGDSNGDYIDARNIQCVPQDENENGSISPTLGNEFAFSLGSVSQQNKRYRIVLDGDIFKFHELRFLSTQRDANMIVPNGPNGGLLFNGTVSDFVNAFNLATAGSGVSWIISTSTPGTVEIELASYPMYQWYIDSVGTHDLNPIVIAEAIPVDLAGPLKDIGSYDLLGDLFIFSTTQDNEPTELPITITTISPTIAGGTIAVGPITYLTFSAPHGMVQGQWIRITESGNSWLNGSFLVSQVLSPTQIGIPTVLAWGGQLPQVAPGSETIIVNSKGIGEIGVAKKNENTDSWTYIRLLRSVELNFVSKWKIDSHGHLDASGRNLYYTDDYNPPRRFRFVEGYQVDGALNFVSTVNEYNFESIFIQSSLSVSSPPLVFVFIEQAQTGGGLMAGNKYYSARLITAGGDTSGWSPLSGGVNVFKKNIVSDNPKDIYGNDSIATTKSNKLRIDNINNLLAQDIEVAVIEDIDGALTARIIKRETLTSTSIEFVHTGLEIDSILLDVNEIAGDSDEHSPIKVKNIRSIDSRNVMSNIETINKVNLLEWTATFRHSIKRKTIEEATKFKTGEYQIPTNVFFNMGFMYNETYRVGCRAYIKGIGRTAVFWVDDVRVDANATNLSNPTDNRRNSGAQNYDLVKEVHVPDRTKLTSANQTSPGINTGSPNDPMFTDQYGVDWVNGSDGWTQFSASEFFIGAGGAQLGSSIHDVYVPYISIEDIDFSFEISSLGAQAKDVIEALEFFVADTPKSVKASGLGIMSVQSFDSASGGSMTYGGEPSSSEYNSSASPLRNIPTFPLWPTSVDDKYLMEWPYATGSFLNRPGDTVNNTSNSAGIGVSVNYPIAHEPSGSSNKFEERRDVISFYSGDTVFDPDKNYAGKSLIVFGAMELESNLKNRIGGSFGFPFQNVTGRERGGKSTSFRAKFVPRLTKNSYTEYPINAVEYIDPASLPQPIGLDFANALYDLAPTSWITDEVTRDMLFAVNVGGEYFSKRLPMLSQFFDELDSGDFFVANDITNVRVATTVVNQRGPVIKLASPIDFNDADISPSYLNNQEVFRYSNRGCVYCQIYNDETNLFPDLHTTQYLPTGSMMLTPTSTVIAKHDMTCGDTFTQTAIIKHRSNGATKENLDEGAAYILGKTGNALGLVNLTSGRELDAAREMLITGFGSGILLTCQNRINANMFTLDEDPLSEQVSYPRDSVQYWLAAFEYETTPEYNKHYNANPFPFGFSAYFNPEILRGARFDFPTRIMYSLRKDEEGIFDEYRVFLPLNIKDLDRTFGEIMHHENVNGELFTLQLRKWQSQFFNTRGEIQVSGNALGAIIGDGSVLSRDGQTLSIYGTQNKWSAAIGTSSGGKDVLYWFNSENGLFMRFGADGTAVLSDSRKMRVFSNKATKWIYGKDTPAHNQGVRCVWDSRSKEVIWTFTGWRDLGEWLAIFIEVGDVVRNNNAPSDSYEGFPRFFKCKLVHIGSSLTEPGVGVDWETYWEQISYDDTNYYSIFTVAFNEATNGFSTFYGHIPKTYLKWRDTFLSSHPTERNLIFEHRKGEPTTWYGVDSFLTGTIPPKIEDAYIEAVINDLPEESKRFISTEVLSENVPDRIEYRTKSQYTWSEPADFKVNDDQFRGFILNDATVSQDPRGNTRRMDGDYIKAKFFFIGGTMNKLYSIVVKLRGRLRDFRQ